MEWGNPWMKEERDKTGGVGGPPTLPGLYLSTFQPSQPGFFRVCEGRESLSPNLKLLTPGINSALFSQKKINTLKIIVSSFLTPTIVDSILCTTSIPGINFSPLYIPTKILPLENFVR
jgi:hypothetical protein